MKPTCTALLLAGLVALSAGCADNKDTITPDTGVPSPSTSPGQSLTPLPTPSATP